jgi:hypothetical protein
MDPSEARVPGLLVERIARLDSELVRLDARVADLKAQCRALRNERDETRQAISDNGGDRLERLKAEIENMTGQQNDRRRRAEDYGALARALDLPEPEDAADFDASRREAERRLAALEGEEADLQNRLTEAAVAVRDGDKQREELEAELASLKRRRSNIPAAMLALRERLCAGLGLAPDALPFAGELLQVRDDERDWEGAIERLLHNFGLSLLVPNEHYRAVAEWVDRTHLRGRLVYYRVVEQRDGGLPDLHPSSLVRKLQIRPESVFYAWLERELARRFDYACAADLDQFRREKKAVTRAGQTKGGGERHEKDDRHAIDDRSRYVLGWSNEAKIAALARRAADLERIAAEGRRKQEQIQRAHRELRERGNVLNRLLTFRDFRDLDWRPLTLEIERLEQERKALEAASDVLRTLQAQLQAIDARLAGAEDARSDAEKKHAVEAEKRDTAGQMLADARALLDATPEDAKALYFPRLEALRDEALGEHRLTVESCDNREREMRDWLQGRIDAETKRLERLAESIIKAMTSYKNTWPVETSEVDNSVAAAPEYRRMLEQLRADDLPRFEKRFKELLNENTIREVAGFQAQLNRARGDPRAHRDDQPLAARDRLQPEPLHLLARRARAGSGHPRAARTAQSLHGGRRHGLRGRAVFGGEVSAGPGDHRALSRPRGVDGARRALDSQGDGRTQLVRVLRFRAVARGRSRARALHRFGREVRRAEGEARLYGARGEPRLPVRPRVGRAAFPVVSLRRDRRGVRPRLGRVHTLRARALQAPEPPAADRDAAAEDPRHRALRRERRLRAQRGRPPVDAAQPHDRGVSRGAGGAPRVVGTPRRSGVRALFSSMTWTTAEAIAERVAASWRRGEILAARIRGAQLFPMRLRLKVPTSREVTDRFGEVLDWARALDRASRASRGYGFDLERELRSNRVQGTNALPVAAVIPTEADALRLINCSAAAARFEALADETLARFPELREWLARRPLAALEHSASWPAVLAVLAWFKAHPRPRLYLRQLDIPGVDTKFIEMHRPLLSELLDLVLPSACVDASATGTKGFARRFGLRSPPPLVRFRLLDPRLYIHGMSDISLPPKQFAALELSAARVFITENVTNGLAFPDCSGSVVVFGLGYGLDRLSEVDWLRRVETHYWGDIDTHGFGMLNRLRAALPEARSFLMDGATLEMHRKLWVTEPAELRYAGDTSRLTSAERELFDNLRSDVLGERVRLEQERIGFGWIERALARL